MTWNFGRSMQYELRELQQRLGITFVFVTSRPEALPWWLDLCEGEIVQSGTPVDIYDEPINHCGDFWESTSTPVAWSGTTWLKVQWQALWNGRWGMRPTRPVEVVIRPEDLRITLPEGKLQVKWTQLFRGVHYEIIAYDDLGNEWMILHSEEPSWEKSSNWSFEPEDITLCVSAWNRKKKFDARIEVRWVEEQEAGLINAIEEEEMKKQPLIYLSSLFLVCVVFLFVLAPVVMIIFQSF